MSLSDLEQHVFAYYVGGQAKELNIAPRFYPYGELTLIIEDKVQTATRKFGPLVRGKAKPVAKAFVDLMIEKGAWSTKENEFGGTMHQFQPDAYRSAINELNQSNPIIRKSLEDGADFWVEAFAGFTGSTGQ